ncbi:hypothetical protein [Chryseobacterium arachidis]|nr:hypothetical protein [Chryseobacterium arachidis]
MKILDAEDGKPIANTRIILPNEVIYTNDDGIALVPEQAKNLEVSKTGYQSEKLETIVPVLKLKPLYRDIQEVKIVTIDIRKLLEDVNRSYTKTYYSKPSLYNIIYKEKNTYDNELKLLMVADAKFWTESNFYNYKYKLRNEYEKFIQIELNNIRFFKSAPVNDSLITSTTKVGKSDDYIGFIFMNYTLKRLVDHINFNGSKSSGRIVNDDGEEQTIHFSVRTKSGVKLIGKLLYHKADKVITHLEIEYDQSEFAPIKLKNSAGEEFQFQPGNGMMSLDYYKKDKKYIPSKTMMRSDNYIIYKGEKHRRTFDRDITFQTFSETKEKGLANRIDVHKNMWENVPNHEQKDSKIALSKEEQEFINEK